MEKVNKNLAARACVNRELRKTYYEKYKYVIITQWMFLNYDKKDPIGIYEQAKIFIRLFNKRIYDAKILKNSDEEEYIVIEIKDNMYLKINTMLKRKKFLEEYLKRRMNEHVFKRNYEDSNDGEFYIKITKKELNSIGIFISIKKVYDVISGILKENAVQYAISYDENEIEIAWSYH